MRNESIFPHKKMNEAGFTIAEALFYFSLISLISVFTFAFATKVENNTFSDKVQSDFDIISNIVSVYNKDHVMPPCHTHNMSDTNEKEWSKDLGVWPDSPDSTKYFLAHSGDKDTPSKSDYNYIGVALDEKNAIKYDMLYDDGNIEKGNFRFVALPLPHYSYFLSYIKTGSHTHCE